MVLGSLIFLGKNLTESFSFFHGRDIISDLRFSGVPSLIARGDQSLISDFYEVISLILDSVPHPPSPTPQYSTYTIHNRLIRHT